MEKSWKIHYKWPFSIAMLVHQRVCDMFPGSIFLMKFPWDWWFQPTILKEKNQIPVVGMVSELASTWAKP